MRHVEFTCIRDNCKALLDLRDEIMKNHQAGLDLKTKVRIVSVKTKMRNFNFLFCLEMAIVVRS